MVKNFTGNFTQQEPIPDEGVKAALRVMQHGRLHRYNVVDGEESETSLLETEFAAYTGSKYCLSVASGGYALAASLRAVGVKQGDKVLTNAFTLAPVPGAIANAGGIPIFVEVTQDLVMNLDDLQVKIKSSGAKCLMLSHMRGHIVDMDAIMAICSAADVIVIEDCAHTMGAKWKDTPSGRHGAVGCYSTQTFKHINSGEGGLLITDDPEIMARATMLSGSYMLYGQHAAGAPVEIFENISLDTPNCSGRMDNLRAAILRPQLAALDTQAEKWNERYKRLEASLQNVAGLRVIPRPPEEDYVASSFQFTLPDWDAGKVRDVQNRCAARGVELKWFGADTPTGFTSRHDSWRYVDAQAMPQTDHVLMGLLDMRLPLTFSLEDCDLLAAIIREEVGAVYQAET